jgi:ABC-type methionine transport system permease subunit
VLYPRPKIAVRIPLQKIEQNGNMIITGTEKVLTMVTKITTSGQAVDGGGDGGGGVGVALKKENFERHEEEVVVVVVVDDDDDVKLV